MIALSHEVRRLLRSRATHGFWLVLAVLCVLATLGGRRWRSEVDDARDDARARVDEEIAALDAPAQEPWAVPWVTLGRIPVRAELAPAALSAAAIDRIDRHALDSPVSVSPPEPDDAEAALVSPLALAAGRFDLAAVIVVLLPLGLIASTHDIVVGERQRGTLAMIRTLTPSLRRWTLQIAVARWLVLVLVLPSIAIIAGCTAALSSEVDGSIVALLATTALYGAFWIAVAATIGVRARSSTWAVTANVAVWALLVVIAPETIAIASRVVVPIPSPVGLELETQRDALDFQRDGKQLVSSYLDEHPELPRTNVQDDPRAWAKPYVLTLRAEADRRLPELRAQEASRASRRRTVHVVMAAVSPAAVAHEVLVVLAGHDDARLAAYRDAVHDARASRRTALVDRVLGEREFDRHDVALTAALPIDPALQWERAAGWLAVLVLQLGLVASTLWWRSTERFGD